MAAEAGANVYATYDVRCTFPLACFCDATRVFQKIIHVYSLSQHIRILYIMRHVLLRCEHFHFSFLHLELMREKTNFRSHTLRGFNGQCICGLYEYTTTSLASLMEDGALFPFFSYLIPNSYFKRTITGAGREKIVRSTHIRLSGSHWLFFLFNWRQIHRLWKLKQNSKGWKELLYGVFLCTSMLNSFCFCSTATAANL